VKLLKHKVKKGEDLSKIAVFHGLKNWRALYDAPENKELRKKRTDPNKIMPGDIVNIPLGRLSPGDAKKFDAAIAATLLRKSADERFSPFPRRIYPTAFVIGMPRAV